MGYDREKLEEASIRHVEHSLNNSITINPLEIKVGV